MGLHPLNPEPCSKLWRVRLRESHLSRTSDFAENAVDPARRAVQYSSPSSRMMPRPPREHELRKSLLRSGAAGQDDPFFLAPTRPRPPWASLSG